MRLIGKSLTLSCLVTVLAYLIKYALDGGSLPATTGFRTVDQRGIRFSVFSSEIRNTFSKLDGLVMQFRADTTVILFESLSLLLVGRDLLLELSDVVHSTTFLTGYLCSNVGIHYFKFMIAMRCGTQSHSMFIDFHDTNSVINDNLS